VVRKRMQFQFDCIFDIFGEIAVEKRFPAVKANVLNPYSAQSSRTPFYHSRDN